MTIEELLQEYHQFDDRFQNGNGKWTPTKEDWLRNEEVGRKLLLAAMQQYMPNVGKEYVEWCEHYLDPSRWRASDFLEKVMATVAQSIKGNVVEKENIETVADLTSFLSLPQNRKGTWWDEDEGIVRFFHEEPDEDGDRVIFSLSESEFVEDFFSQFHLKRGRVYNEEK